MRGGFLVRYHKHFCGSFLVETMGFRLSFLWVERQDAVHSRLKSTHSGKECGRRKKGLQEGPAFGLGLVSEGWVIFQLLAVRKAQPAVRMGRDKAFMDP